MKNKIRIVYFFSLAGTLIWIGFIFLAPYLKSHSSSLNSVVYALFSPVCHQIPERSFFCFGYPLAVCSRCMGIYSGFLAGLGLFPIINGFSSLSLPRTKLFILLTIPIGIDTIGNLFHIWATSGLMRFSIGFLWGIILPFYFVIGMAEALMSFCSGQAFFLFRKAPIEKDKEASLFP
ncbi:MAG: DUF2085 domain-containing protein [Candidatus Aminicenantales bacterium]